MRLFIAEKPSLAKAIFEGLGGNPETEKKNGYFQCGQDIVTWCVGHMLELYDPQDYDDKYSKWNFSDLPIKTVFPPKLKIKKQTAAQTNIVLSLIKEASTIVHAGDPDEEGCLLVDELLDYCGNKKPVERLLVVDLNLAPVQKALANMQPNANFRGMTNSALARSVCDQGFGYNLTRGFTLKGREKGFEGVLNVGRVQSATLGLINARTLANQNHTVSYYYDVYGSIFIKGHTVKAKYQVVDTDQVDDKKRLISEAHVKHIAERIKGKKAVVTVVTTKPENTAPPMPLDLGSLQIICAKKYGYSAKETLEILQSLYETHKLVSYPRTNCRYLSDEHYYQAPDIVKAIGQTFPELLSAVNGINKDQKHKAFNSKKIEGEAHHALIPSQKNGANIRLTPKERNVYNLIAISFTALFYADSVRNKTKVHFDVDKDTFTATQSVLICKGWEVLGKNQVNDDEDNFDAEEVTGLDLSTLKFSDTGNCESSNFDKKKTEPPKYFTESTLIAAMKNAGRFVKDPALRKALEEKEGGGTLGTEATRAGILEKLSANTGLVTIEKIKGYSEAIWKTTKQGQELCEKFPDEITQPDISAIWAEKQALIKSGGMPVSEFINYNDEYIKGIIDDLFKNGLNISANTYACPDCQKPMRKIKGVNGEFWACSGFRADPQCKKTLPDYKGEPDFGGKGKAALEAKKAKDAKATTCPNCQKRLKRMKSKKAEGEFYWACEGVFDKSCVSFFTDVKGKPELKKKAEAKKKS
ncbi:DNA topoisomerase III [Citrobacter sp. NCU1]|uniref:DNA topoisomerase III n=1 Tax=Citrobacter sp. NCU1 TaxID=2026683 RepID=UPI001390AEB4|nr:DNA topoisomerase III [Citrobacter sp. NCU1]NDO82792.1 DNA topoisomerase III [Citrobacter sp. NCU1]